MELTPSDHNKTNLILDNADDEILGEDLQQAECAQPFLKEHSTYGKKTTADNLKTFEPPYPIGQAGAFGGPVQSNHHEINNWPRYNNEHQTNHPWSSGQHHNTHVAVVSSAPPPYTGQIDRVITETPRVPNYVPLSIFSLICCCWPLGIFALLKAIDANKLRHEGKHEEARKKSNSSLRINVTAIFVGVILTGIYLAYHFLVYAKAKKTYP